MGDVRAKLFYRFKVKLECLKFTQKLNTWWCLPLNFILLLLPCGFILAYVFILYHSQTYMRIIKIFQSWYGGSILATSETQVIQDCIIYICSNIIMLSNHLLVSILKLFQIYLVCAEENVEWEYLWVSQNEIRVISFNNSTPFVRRYADWPSSSHNTELSQSHILIEIKSVLIYISSSWTFIKRIHVCSRWYLHIIFFSPAPYDSSWKAHDDVSFQVWTDT